MKIAYLSGSLFPSVAANSIHVFKMGNAIAANGHQLLLIGKKSPGQPANDQTLEDFYGNKPAFKYELIDLSGKRLANVFYAHTAYKLTSKFNPDIYYGRHIISCMYHVFKRKNTMVELHMLPSFTGIKALLFKRFIKSKYLKKVVVISDQLKIDVVKAYGIDADRVIVAHDAADDVKPYNTKQLFNPEKFNVGYIGHLYPGKGMEIISELIPRIPSVHFNIIGGTDKDIAAWDAKLKENSNYTFHGMVSPKETVNYRYAADLLIAPYSKVVNSRAGNSIAAWMSPLKLFEYMAAGKPIITTDLPVIREVLTQNEDGILADPENMNDWVEQIIRLKDDKALREKLGAAARAEFVSKYTWTQRAKFIFTTEHTH
ncbi:MAG: glycosyltransferase [Sphingobacteriaceae bacterium]|nr:MAG: glycosyltransferase [Sphingobacteriaceae bacterium]